MKIVFCLVVIIQLLSCNKVKQNNESSSIKRITYSVESDFADEVQIFFHQNGTIDAIQYQKNKKLNGPAYGFDTTGLILESSIFNSHLTQGYVFWYYPSGFIQSVRFTVDGENVGWGADYYDSAGVIKTAYGYNDESQLIFKREFTPFGEIISTEGEQIFGKYW